MNMGSLVGNRPQFYSFVFTLSLFIHHLRSVSVERSLYIVHMDESLMPAAFSDHHSWYTSTVESAKTASKSSPHRSQLIYSYNHALNGFSAMLSREELETVKVSAGFVSAYPDMKVKLRTTHTPDFLSLSPTGGLWPASDYGTDIVIGFVDSGIWPESESFKDDGMTPIPSTWKGKCEDGTQFDSSMCNLKLVGARYFNKGLLAKNPGINITMNSARDEDGHGTHTSSTAGGNYVRGASFFGYAKGTVRGIAPRARIAMYKPFFGEGMTTSDLLAALDQAVADGVHILSLSLGIDEDLPWYENPLAIACFGAMEKGIVVSHAGGNSGPGPYTLYDSIPWTVTVGAGTIDRSLAAKVTLGNGLTIDGWSAFPASALLDKLPLVYSKNLSCGSAESISQISTDSILVCDDFGLASLSTIQGNTKHVAGVISIFPPVEDILLGLEFQWPAAYISQDDGADVIKYATTSTNPTASMSFQRTVIGKRKAPFVSSYSSRGPLRSYPDLLKPDILAPGSVVLAAWVPNQELAQIGSSISLSGEFNIIDGTSMACPHIAGVAALLKSAHPDWSASAIKSAMMTTANPLDNTHNPILEYGEGKIEQATSLDMGSGHVDPNRALDPGLVYDATPQDYVNLMCSLGYTKEKLLTVTRSKNYSCSNPSGDLNYPSFISIYTNVTVVQTFERTVTNVGNANATYNVEVTAPLGSRIKVSPEKLVFGEKYDKAQKFTVTIEYEVVGKNGTITDGELVWVEEAGKYKVRSPIVVAPRMKF